MRHVTLVVGAPCSGKSTYVAEHEQPGDIVVDWDRLAVAAGSPMPHEHAKPYAAEASRRRRDLEDQVAAMADGTAWVIRTLPRPEERAAAALRLEAHVLVLDPGVEACLMRAKLDGRPASVDALILRWYGIAWGARCYDKTQKAPGPDPRRTPEWRRVRKLVLAGRPPCAICGLPMAYGVPYNRQHPDPLYPTVDHIIPIEAGGSWYDPSNLRPAHWKCNTDRGASRTDRALEPAHRTSEEW